MLMLGRGFSADAAPYSCYVTAFKENRAYSRTCLVAPSQLPCVLIPNTRRLGLGRRRDTGLAPIGGVCFMLGWLSLVF